MTKNIETFLEERLSKVQEEYASRKDENSLDSEDRGYFDGVIDAYETVLNHIAHILKGNQ
jgi:hypothetical protein